jgi:hypothetical protein
LSCISGAKLICKQSFFPAINARALVTQTMKNCDYSDAPVSARRNNHYYSDAPVSVRLKNCNYSDAPDSVRLKKYNYSNAPVSVRLKIVITVMPQFQHVCKKMRLQWCPSFSTFETLQLQ